MRDSSFLKQVYDIRARDEHDENALIVFVTFGRVSTVSVSEKCDETLHAEDCEEIS